MHAHTHTQFPRDLLEMSTGRVSYVKQERHSVSSKQVNVGMLKCASLNLQKPCQSDVSVAVRAEQQLLKRQQHERVRPCTVCREAQTDGCRRAVEI